MINLGPFTRLPKPIQSNRTFKDAIWGKMPKLHLPSSIVDKKQDTLRLDDYALNVLIALLHIERNQSFNRHKRDPSFYSNDAVVQADRDSLMQITGMSKNLISKGLKSLTNAGYIQNVAVQYNNQPKPRFVHDRLGQFAVGQYVLLNHATGDVLHVSDDHSLLYANGLHYFIIPAQILKRGLKRKPEPYQFNTLTLAEKRLYVVLAWIATQEQSPEIDITGHRLKLLTGFSNRSLAKALEGLESRQLVLNTAEDPTIRNLRLVLRNPITHELLGQQTFDRDPRNNACNWYEERKDGRLKNADLRMTPEIAESMFLERLDRRGEVAIREGKGEYKFCCPFHEDSTPSCNFNPRKGCFWCFSPVCNAKGTTLTLLRQLSGARGEQIIRDVALALGKTLTHKDPDWRAVAIYDYRDKFGNLRKQVIRQQDDDHGIRRFTQRRPAKDGSWIYDVKNVKPMLFNLDKFQYATIAIVCEGEKDATTVTSLELHGGAKGVIHAVGTTSGGADSWDSKLANDLKGLRQVIIMPDDDAAGEKYAQAVAQSLRNVGIEPLIVSFNGTGAKDVTEYMANHTVEDLVRLIGVDRINMPDGSKLSDESEELDVSYEPITI
jgi:5S rRNA maturation endonuclease (ribonuclease M5)